MLELSKFAKIAEDKNTTTLKHKDGHTMTILHTALPKIQREQLKRLKMADGGDVSSDTPNPSPNQSSDDSDSQQPDHSTTININAAPPSQSDNQSQNQPAQQSPTTSPAAVSLPNSVAQAKETLGGVNQGITAAQKQVPIDVATAQAKAQAEQAQIQNSQQAAQRQQDNYSKVNDMTNSFQQYLESNPIQKINPNAYLENMDAGNKIATTIGLILGGFSGTANNPAMNYLQGQIARNVAAQEKNADQFRTIYGAYHEALGDRQAALKAATASTADLISHQVGLAVAQQGTPQAYVNGLKAQSALKETSDAARKAAAGILDAAQAPASQVGAVAVPQMPKKYNDQNLRPGSSVAPETPPPPQISVDYNKMNRSQYLGAQGAPGQLQPGEVGEASKEADDANSANQAIRAIHDAYQDMWKNSGPQDFNDIAKLTKDQNVFGLHVPDVSNWSQGAKRYFTAASTVKKQLANIIAGGGSSELYSLVEDQLPRGNDTPDDYRKKLDNVDKIIQQQLHISALKKYGLASGLPQ